MIPGVHFGQPTIITATGGSSLRLAVPKSARLVAFWGMGSGGGGGGGFSAVSGSGKGGGGGGGCGDQWRGFVPASLFEALGLFVRVGSGGPGGVQSAGGTTGGTTAFGIGPAALTLVQFGSGSGGGAPTSTAGGAAGTTGAIAGNSLVYSIQAAGTAATAGSTPGTGASPLNMVYGQSSGGSGGGSVSAADGLFASGAITSPSSEIAPGAAALTSGPGADGIWLPQHRFGFPGQGGGPNATGTGGIGGKGGYGCGGGGGGGGLTGGRGGDGGDGIIYFWFLS